MKQPFFTEEGLDQLLSATYPLSQSNILSVLTIYSNEKVAPLLERLEKLESLVRGAVDSWGDYSPLPQSKAGKTLIEMKLYIRGIEINESKT